MICLSVHRNGVLACNAALSGITVVTAIVAGGRDNDDPAGFHVAGMQDLPAGRHAHVYWVPETALAAGESLSFSLADCDTASTPVEIRASDTPEYLQEQRDYDALQNGYMGPEPYAEQRWPTLEFRIALRNDKLVARLAGDDAHVLCSLTWNQWEPGKCRVSVRSFPGASSGQEKQTTEWLAAELALGDSLEVAIHT